MAEMNHAGLDISVTQYFLGLLSIFTVALGGLFIGIVVGFLSALITKTTRDVRVMEPLALLGTAFLAYMSAELFHWSGIIRHVAQVQLTPMEPHCKQTTDIWK